MSIDILTSLGLRWLWPARVQPPSPPRARVGRMQPPSADKPTSPVTRTRQETRHRVDAVEEVKPAKAVIPRDAVQMPPPGAASPGLPPVDPGKETDVGAGDGLRRLKDVEGTEEQPTTEPAQSFDEAILTPAEVPANEFPTSPKRMKDRAAGARKPSTSKRRSPSKRGNSVDPAKD